VSAGDRFVSDPNEGTVGMIVIGADTHKHSHTVDAATGRERGAARARRRSFDDLLRSAPSACGRSRTAAACPGLERFLLLRGERVVRVAPTLVADARRLSVLLGVRPGRHVLVSLGIGLRSGS
jgi:hypothetical protein